MKRYLIVVDMQNDFVSGSLGTAEALAILPAVERKIREFDGEVIATLDTHFDSYLETAEGKHLPVVHCVKGTEGHKIAPSVSAALEAKGYTAIEKHTFGSIKLPQLIDCDGNGEGLYIELIGLCTDICVVSNALLLKAHFPEALIAVDSTCTAGVTPQSKNKALDTMRMCQIEILN